MSTRISRINGQRPVLRGALRAPARNAGLLLGAAMGLALVAAIKLRRRRATYHWTPPSGVVTHGALTARSLGSTGPPIVLLHGMVGSNISWGGEFDELAQRSRLVAIDLLGFGDSPKPAFGYSARDHADAVAACLDELAIDEPAVVVGHSMGTLVALALARYHPELVATIVAISPPVYDSRKEGARHIRAMGLPMRLMALGEASRVICHWQCEHRELARRLAPFMAPGVPKPIARAVIDHTWASYSQSLEELILSGEAPGWLLATTRPVHLVAALDDPVPDLPLLSRLCAANQLLSLDLWPGGGHLLPQTQPVKCVAAIRDAAARKR